MDATAFTTVIQKHPPIYTKHTSTMQREAHVNVQIGTINDEPIEISNLKEKNFAYKQRIYCNVNFTRITIQRKSKTFFQRTLY